MVCILGHKLLRLNNNYKLCMNEWKVGMEKEAKGNKWPYMFSLIKVV